MTRDEGVAHIMEQLGFRVSSTTEAAIVRGLQLAQTMLESAPVKPWFLVSEDTYTTTIPDEERVPLPDDFLEEVEDATFKYRPADYPDEDEVDLVKDEYDVLRRNFAEVDAGEPEAYALLGNYFRMFPLPDDAYSIRLIYFKRDTSLATNVENGWLKWVPYLILGTAGLQISKGPLRDAGAVAVFQDWIQMGMGALNSQTNAREMANRKLQMGGPHQ